MGVQRLMYGVVCLPIACFTACGAPDTPDWAASEPSAGRLADTSSHEASDSAPSRPDTIRETIDPVLLPCYSVQFSDGVLSRPVVLPRRFTGQIFLVVEADTARRQLTNFRLQAVRLDQSRGGSGSVRLNFDKENPVPDSLASLLPQLEQHIRKLRPQVVVSRDKSCVMPLNWIIPIRIR